MKKLYIIDTDTNAILDRTENLKNNWGCGQENYSTRKVYEAEEVLNAIQFSDLVDPVDVSDKRIYLVE